MRAIMPTILADPKLPQLRVVVDAAEMKQRFAALFREKSLKVLQCKIEKCYYRRFRHCGVLYRLICQQTDGVEEDHWFFGQAFEMAHSRKMYNKSCQQVNGRTDNHEIHVLDGVTFWESLGMVLWRFPVDRKLDTLPRVANCSFISEVLSKNRNLFVPETTVWTGSPDTSDYLPVRVNKTKYMPGKRCVLRVESGQPEAGGPERGISFFSKTYSDTMSHYHFQNLCEAYERSRENGAVTIPRPLLHLDGFKTFWQEDWRGGALVEELAARNWENLFPRIATTLAAFHGGDERGFRPCPDLEDVLRVAHEDAAQFVFLFPEWQNMMQSVLSALDAGVAKLQRRTPPTVPIHGAFRIEQIIVRENELALIDFDALSRGDPLFDVAEFVASLQFLALSQGLVPRDLTDAARLFCKTYSDLVFWPFDTDLLRWYVLAFLVSKVFLTVKGLDLHAMRRLHTDGVALIQFWLKGRF